MTIEKKKIEKIGLVLAYANAIPLSRKTMKNRICTFVSKPLTGPLASVKNKPKKNARLPNGLGHYSVTGLAKIPKRYRKKDKLKRKLKKEETLAEPASALLRSSGEKRRQALAAASKIKAFFHI